MSKTFLTRLGSVAISALNVIAVPVAVLLLILLVIWLLSAAPAQQARLDAIHYATIVGIENFKDQPAVLSDRNPNLSVVRTGIVDVSVDPSFTTIIVSRPFTLTLDVLGRAPRTLSAYDGVTDYAGTSGRSLRFTGFLQLERSIPNGLYFTRVRLASDSISGSAGLTVETNSLQTDI